MAAGPTGIPKPPSLTQDAADVVATTVDQLTTTKEVDAFAPVVGIGQGFGPGRVPRVGAVRRVPGPPSAPTCPTAGPGYRKPIRDSGHTRMNARPMNRLPETGPMTLESAESVRLSPSMKYSPAGIRQDSGGEGRQPGMR